MQLIETTSPAQRRRGDAVRVPWTELADQQRRRGEAVRALPPGEHVVLHLDGHFHLGRVVSYLGEGVEGTYVLSIGATMSAQSGRWLAASGNARNAGPDQADDEVTAVVRIPAQRTATEDRPRG